MITRSRIVSGGSALASEPPDEPLPRGVPMHLRYELCADIETDLLRDVNLSSENRAVSMTEITFSPQQPDFAVDVPDLETPCYAQLLLLPTDAFPVDVEITNLSLLLGKTFGRRLCVAFYDDHPQQGKVSWLPTGEETLRLWYDRSPVTDPSPDQANMTLTDSYLPLVKLLLAAQMLELTGKTVGAVLQSRITRSMKQWERFVTQSRQQGVAIKEPWRRSRGYGRRGAWDTADGFRLL